MNLHIHFHVVVLDGVFTRDAHGVPRFHEAPAPTRGELDDVVRRVHRRALVWLARHGHVEASEHTANEAPEPVPLDACAAIAMQRGNVQAVAHVADAQEGDAQVPYAPSVAHDASDFEGFNLHASVRIDADDDLGRERLCRYGARPPLALDRLRVLPGGRSRTASRRSAIANGFDVPDQTRPDVADLMETTQSGFGEMTAVRHAAVLSETPARWVRPSVRLGTHRPEWP